MCGHSRPCTMVRMGAHALVLAACLAAAAANVHVMKNITLVFGQALDKCREESQLTEDKMEQFFHFWSKDFKFDMRELGCAIQCMSRYYNLLTDSSHMHHDNTLQFINSFPNGEVLGRLMVDMIHACEKRFNHEEDHCWRILHTAECFKDSCVNAKLAPTMEVAIAEFIMETEPQ